MVGVRFSTYRPNSPALSVRGNNSCNNHPIFPIQPSPNMSIGRPGPYPQHPAVHPTLPSVVACNSPKMLGIRMFLTPPRPIPQMEQKEFLRAKDERTSCPGGRLPEMVYTSEPLL